MYFEIIPERTGIKEADKQVEYKNKICEQVFINEDVKSLRWQAS